MHCGRELVLLPSEVREKRTTTRRTFCSHQCAGAARSACAQREGPRHQCTALCGACEVCGAHVRARRRFCSNECYLVTHRRKPKQCLCGKEFLASVPTQIHCSTRCMGVANRGNQRHKLRKQPWVMPGHIRARFSEERVGAGNPRWGGGSPTNRKFRFQSFVREWTLRAFPLCPCGQPSTETQHVVPRRYFLDVRMSHFAENLLGMCVQCHRKADRWVKMARRTRSIDLRFADRLPESILVQLQKDGLVSQLPQGLDWSPLGNVAEEVLLAEWFESPEAHADIVRSA